VFIGLVDDALEGFLRARLSSGEGGFTDSPDVSVAAPTAQWAALLTRPTVNLHLFRVGRSTETVRAPQRRFDANGRPERRAATVQMIDLRYAVTAWAPDAATEHRLLGRVVSLFAVVTAVPAEFVADSMGAPITVSFAPLDDVAFVLPGTDPAKAVAMVTVGAAADAVAGDEIPDVRPMRPMPMQDR
jgi:Pvc16 N-terminal domain